MTLMHFQPIKYIEQRKKYKINVFIISCLRFNIKLLFGLSRSFATIPINMINMTTSKALHMNSETKTKIILNANDFFLQLSNNYDVGLLSKLS